MEKIKAWFAALTKQQKIIIACTAGVVVALAAGVGIYEYANRDKTLDIDEPVTVVEDADDGDASIVEEMAASNLIELTDEAGNVLTLIPINDVTNTYMVSAFVQSAKDKDGKAITDTSLIGRVIAVSADTSTGATVYSFKLNNGSKIFLDFYTNENKDMIAVQSYDDGKLYEVETTRGDTGYIYMHLKSTDGKTPIEVTATDNGDGKYTVAEKSTGTVLSKAAIKNGTIVTETTPTGSSPADTPTSAAQTTAGGADAPEQEQDNIVGFADYSDLADINVILKANTTAAVGLDANSPITDIDAKSKAYVSGGALYLVGNGDYYITQENQNSTWYGKIIVQLGNQGLARVRMAGVDITSSDSFAIEFQDTDTVINDTDSDGEALVYKNTASTKNNPNAVLSFVEGTTSSLRANGNANNYGSGTIYSECKLSVKGHGIVNIHSKNKNGIYAERSVAIQNCTMNITSELAKGIRVKGTLDIEENATITVNSVGDGIRCNTFIMDTDVKDSSGNKDKSTGSNVTVNVDSTTISKNGGDGIDADDAAIIRAGSLNVFVVSTESEGRKFKWGVKVRRVNNEEFLKALNTDGYDVVSSTFGEYGFNQKEFEALVATASVSPSSADYQGLRTAAGYSDTFRITGGAVRVESTMGKNSMVQTSTNTQPSVNVLASKQRTITIDGVSSSTTVKAFLYSSGNLNTSSCTVVFAKAGAGNANKAITVQAQFNNGVAYVTDN